MVMRFETKYLKSCVLLLIVAITILGWIGIVAAAPNLELFTTFETLGIVVTIDTNDDPDKDSTTKVEYRITGGTYHEGFRLDRVDPTRFVGSLFWLEPGTSYDVRVTFDDPDGDPINAIVVSDTKFTRSEISIPAASNSYYVSPNGGGTQCLIDKPCTLREGLNRAVAGDEVILRGGVYYQGEISLSNGGYPDSPIVIRSYNNETPILDGSDPQDFTWTSQGNGIYKTTVNKSNVKLIVANGKRLFPYASLSDLQNLVWDVPGFYNTGYDVYVRLENDTDPNNAEMEIARYNYAFNNNTKDYIYILDLTFRYYGQGSSPKVLNIDGANNNVVQNCKIRISDSGIVIKNNANNNVIQDNEFIEDTFSFPWRGVKDDAPHLETGGFRFSSTVTGRCNVIRRNTFHGFFDGAKICPSTESGMTIEVDFYNNLLYDNGDDGIETDGMCSNLRIWGNTFHNCLDAISLAPARVGPVYAIRNLIYNMGAGNNNWKGGTFKFGSNAPASGPMYIFHNTTDTVRADIDGFSLGEVLNAWEMVYARNNIWVGTDQALYKNTHSGPGDLDYNNLWNGGGGANLARWNSITYNTLENFVSAIGQESHSLSVTPGFMDANNGNYRLLSNSKLIDKGIIIPGINNGYAGAAPDLGAFEYGVSKDSPPDPPIGLKIVK